MTKTVRSGGSITDDGWFVEDDTQWPGHRQALKVLEILYQGKSRFQDVLVFKSQCHGNVLVLDGVVQLTERDEAAYQEMLTHIPMMLHPNPKNVLIIGGGDGGIIREVARYASVESITICEIDDVVMDVCKRFFPTMSASWKDPRLSVVCDDASVYVKDPSLRGTFDVILSDTSDPNGPARPLFEKPFYSDLRELLRPGGLVCTQSESIWTHLPLIKRLVQNGRELFGCAQYATTQVPTYPGGQIGFLVCRRSDERLQETDDMTVIRNTAGTDSSFLQALSYYSPDLHRAAFTLPAFVARELTN